MTNKHRDRKLYQKLREYSDGYTGRELMERKKDGTLFMVVSEEKNRVQIEYWNELEGEKEDILKAWDNPTQEDMVEIYFKTTPKTKPGVRIDDDIHEWLFNRRTTKEPTISDVIRGLITFKEKQ